MRLRRTAYRAWWHLNALVRRGYCFNCERCRWQPEVDCGLAHHPHCVKCGHCEGRHE